MTRQQLPTAMLMNLAVTTPKIANSIAVGQLAVGSGNGIVVRSQPNFASGWNLEQNPTGAIAFLAASSGSYGAGLWLSANSYFNGTAYAAYNTGQSTAYINVSTSGVSVAYAAAATTPAFQWLWAVTSIGTNAASMWVGSGNERIRNTPNNSATLSVESADGMAFLMSKNATYVAGNLYYDGSQWQRFDVSQGSSLFGVTPTNPIIVYTAAAGANPVSWNRTPLVMDGGGNMALSGVLSANGGITMGSNTPINGNGWIGLTGANCSISTDNFVRVTGGASAPPYTTARLVLYNDGSNYAYWSYGGNASAYFVYSAGPYPVFWGTTSGFQGGFTERMQLTGSGDLYVANNLYVRYNTIYLYGDWTRYFQAIGPTIGYSAGSGGGHNFYYNNAASWATCNAAAFTVQSLASTKRNVRSLTDALDLVLHEDLHGVRYDDVQSGEARVGFVADSWMPLLPELVTRTLGEGADEFLGLNYGALGAVTFEALKQYVKRTDAKIAELEARLALH